MGTVRRRRVRRILLGASLFGLFGFGVATAADFFLPSPQQHIQVGRSVEKAQASDDRYFSAFRLIFPQKYGGEWGICDQNFILTDFNRIKGRGWDTLEGEMHLQLGLNCRVRPDWVNGKYLLGIFGRDKKDSDYLTAQAELTIRWEGGGKEQLYVEFGDNERKKTLNPDREDIIPASVSKFQQRVPSAAKDLSIGVGFRAMREYEYPSGQDYYRGFSSGSPLPKDSQDYVDWNRAKADLESWLNENHFVAITTPVKKVSNATYGEWFRQKISAPIQKKIILEKTLSEINDPAITSIQTVSTTHGLKIDVGLRNPTFTEDIELYFAGFDVDYVLDSTGKVLKRYDRHGFPLKSDFRSLPPQYSTNGTITIGPRALPEGSRYLLGSLSLGRYNSERGGVNPPPRLWYNPVVADLQTVYSEQPYEGRIGIRKLILTLRDRITELTNR